MNREGVMSCDAMYCYAIEQAAYRYPFATRNYDKTETLRLGQEKGMKREKGKGKLAESAMRHGHLPSLSELS